MTKYFVVLTIQVAVLLSIAFSIHIHDPMCDIHENIGQHFATPIQLLPVNSTSDWFFPNDTTIRHWYEIGMLECKSQLSKQAIDANIAPLMSVGHTNKCRGRDTFRTITGMMLWPFGPFSTCPTYSKCWFGVLTCGSPDNAKISSISATAIHEAMKKQGKSSMPSYMGWSIRSVYIHMRVFGKEIVVPEQRLYSMVDKQDEVIIGQFALTIPGNNYKLELRQFELYPSILFNWSKDDIKNFGFDMEGHIYLGGSEERVSAGRSQPPNFCCGCDEKTYIGNALLHLDAPDGTDRCPGVSSKVLPLCKPRVSGQPGRWIKTSGGGDRCPILKPAQPSETLNIQSPRYNAFTPGPDTLQMKEFSGDACWIRNYDNEDEGEMGQWAFAPYSCRYHVYTRPELHKCLADKNITHIHFQGDSMSRDLFGTVAEYLGVPRLNDDQLKHMTNELKEKNIKFHTGGVIVSEGYAWDFDHKMLTLVQQPPVPQVVVSNHALAHRQRDVDAFRRSFMDTEYKYWSTEHVPVAPMPQYAFFQSGKDMHGTRGDHWSAERIRRLSEFMRGKFSELGFVELDEWMITAGRIDNYGDRNDGWHFWGTMRQMEAVILFNMICNPN